MKYKQFIPLGILIIIVAGIFVWVKLNPQIVGAAPVFRIYQGGTGTSTSPSYGNLLVGNAGGTYDLTATSSLGLSISGSSLAKGNFLVGNDAGVAQATSTIFINSMGLVTTVNSSTTQFTAGGLSWFNATSTISDLVVTGNMNKTAITVCGDGSCDYTTDGTADDVQIQAALNSASSTGGIIHLKNGTYSLSQYISIPSYVTLEGEGFGTLIKLADNSINSGVTGAIERVAVILPGGLSYANNGGTLYLGVYYKTTYGAQLRNFKLDANREGQTSLIANELYGVLFNWTNNARIENIWVINAHASGIGIWPSNIGGDVDAETIITSNRVEGNGSTTAGTSFDSGIFASNGTGQPTKVIISDNIAIGNRNGFGVEDSSGGVLLNNNIAASSTYNGIVFHTVGRATVNGGFYYNNGQDGIGISGAGERWIALNGVQSYRNKRYGVNMGNDWTVTGSMIVENDDAGIVMNSTNNNIVSGSTIAGNGASSTAALPYGIYIVHGSLTDQVTISGNFFGNDYYSYKVADSQTYGIYESGAVSGNYTGNTFATYGSTQIPIKFGVGSISSAVANYNANSNFNNNVAIGTSSPYSKLSVWGANTTAGVRLFELTNSASTTLASFDNAGTGYFLGNIGIGTTSPLTKLSIQGTAGQPVMNIASSTGASLLYVSESGNVGIGTAAPVYNLDVKGISRTYTSVSPFYSFTIDPANAAGPKLQLGATYDVDAFFELGAWSNINNFDSKNRDLKLYTNNAYIYLDDSAGNVGIGTTSPSAMLAVRGGGYFDGGTIIASSLIATSTLTVDGTSSFTGLATFANASTTLLSATYASSTQLTVSDSVWFTGNSATTTLSTGLEIETSGFVYDRSTNNVGINTASPLYKLQINSPSDVAQADPTAIYLGNTYGNGTIGKNLKLKLYGATTNSIGIGASAGMFELTTLSTGVFAFFKDHATTPVELMRITNAGYVGIATNTPAMRLSVNGDALADSWNVYSDIYRGDALDALSKIKPEEIFGAKSDWVSVDHSSLPEGVLKEASGQQFMSISGLAQMNTQAILQLKDKLDGLYTTKRRLGAIDGDGGFDHAQIKEEIKNEIKEELKPEIERMINEAIDKRISEMSLWQIILSKIK